MEWTDGLVLALVGAAAFTDIMERRIPNGIVYPALAGAAIWGLAGGWMNLMFVLKGMGAGFLLLILFYLLGGMGAGDVKLLAAVGAWKGASFVGAAFFYTALLGGLLTLAYLLWWKWRGQGREKGIPYGVAIALGTGTAYGMGWGL